MLHIRNHDGYTNPAKDVDYMAEQYFPIRFSEIIRSATDSTNKQNYISAVISLYFLTLP